MTVVKNNTDAVDRVAGNAPGIRITSLERLAERAGFEPVGETGLPSETWG
jgi:hypothetical protein